RSGTWSPCASRGSRSRRSHGRPGAPSARSSGSCRTPAGGWPTYSRRREMGPELAPVSGEELEQYVAAYEAALLGGGRADLAAFLPAPAHPLYRPVLTE